MAIRPIEPSEHRAFVNFLQAGMRPDGGPTRVDDDFPVVLAPANHRHLYGDWQDGALVAGLAVLVRGLQTSAGILPVAGLGSVVTRPDRRGEGLSGRLQTAVLAELTRQGVPLAVLWTDRPALYASRGFRPAGWEWHADLSSADLTGCRVPGAVCRPYAPNDLAAVIGLYERHPWRTCREAGDHAALYGMPGTRGLVLCDAAGVVLAYAFAGKGEDFPDYVAEWGGAPPAAAAVLAAMDARGWARHVLLPQGTPDLAALLADRGAGVGPVASGVWAVLAPDVLRRAVTAAGAAAPGGAGERDAAAWLGMVTDDGDVVPGPLRAAIWGLDSV